MLQKIIVLFSLIIFLLLGINTVFAQPEISSVTGTINHKGTIVINGAGFGTKSPAAPLLWDDCEDKTVNDPDAVFSEGGYTETWPSSGASTEYRMQYRNIPYRNLPGPHSRSNKYLVGGHEEPTGEYGGGKPGRAVLATFATDEASKTWWASWYVRLDLNWPDGGSGENYKIWDAIPDTEAYTGETCYGQYVDDKSGPTVKGGPSRSVIYNGNTYRHDADYGQYQFDIHKEGYRSNYAADGFHANERINWVKMEVLIAKNEVGEFGERAYADWCSVGNHWGWYIGNPTHVPNWEYTGGVQDHRGFCVGGYYRKSESGNGYLLDNNAFRYFDDIYLDISLARVILGNALNYDDITIMEPQIPSSWSDNSISCTVNLGRLSNERAYLFVFDADNNHNPRGYPVNIITSEDGGGIETPQLAAPTGLEIVNIEN